MIGLDTSFLIDCLSGSQGSAGILRRAIDRGERVFLPALVLYEWLRGPRTNEELAIQEALLPSAEAAPFGVPEAALSSMLYRQLHESGRRCRGREVDLAIAATVMTRGAELLTLNPRDFRDIPGLRLALI